MKRPLPVYIFVLLLLLALIGGIGAGATVFMKQSPMFMVKGVELKGVVYAEKNRLVDAAGSLSGKSIFAPMNVSQLKGNDPWIKAVTVERDYPDKVVVQVTEKKPVFVYRRGNICGIYTDTADTIATGCERANVIVLESIPAEMLTEFIGIYQDNPDLANYRIELGGGVFTVQTGEFFVTGSYDRKAFTNNWRTFHKGIRQRYEVIDAVDMTVNGKIFVRGLEHAS